LSTYVHAKHCRLVLRGLTTITSTPANSALSSTNARNCAKLQPEILARWALRNRVRSEARANRTIAPQSARNDGDAAHGHLRRELEPGSKLAVVPLLQFVLVGASARVRDVGQPICGSVESMDGRIEQCRLIDVGNELRLDGELHDRHSAYHCRVPYAWQCAAALPPRPEGRSLRAEPW
jgi:hypothetical protein